MGVVLGFSRSVFAITSLIVFSMLFLLAPLVASQPIETKGETWDQTCTENKCLLTLYSYQKYYDHNNTWKQITENFQSQNCGLYDHCVTGNLYEAYITDTYSAPLIKRGETELSLRLDSIAGKHIAAQRATVSDNVLIYTDILPSVDLRYTYLPQTFKEDVIFHDKTFFASLSEDVSLIFTLTLPQNKITSARGVHLYKNLHEQLHIQNLVAYDTAGSVVALDFTLAENGQFTLTVPLKWLQNESRKYPIVVDPTVEITNVQWNGLVSKCNTICPFDDDAGEEIIYTRSSNPSPTISIGEFDDGFFFNQIDRGALRFSLNQIPAESRILSANLTLVWTTLGDQSGTARLTHLEGDDLDYDADKLFDCPAQGHDSNCGFFNDMGNGTVYASGYGTPLIAEVYNITSAVSDIEENLDGNFTVGVYDSAESATAYAEFASKDNANASRRPKLSIYYEEFANETQGRLAIEEGIQNELTNPPIHTDQKIYVVTDQGVHHTGSFDKIAEQGDRTWAFNYITSGESLTNIPSVFSVLNIWEMTDLIYSEIVNSVGGFINDTNN